MNKDFRLLGEMYLMLVESIESIKKYLSKRTSNTDIINFFTKKDNKNAPLFNEGEVIAYFDWLEKQQVNLNTILAYHNKYRSLQPPRKDVRQFKDFSAFEQYVDRILGRAQFKQKMQNLEKQSTLAPDAEDIIVDNEDILILHGADSNKCIRYGAGYSFCVSSKTDNMYDYYRFNTQEDIPEEEEDQPIGGNTFYFIFFKKIPKTNPKHICVLYINAEGRVAWTFADNDTKDTTWEEIIQTYPILAKYKNELIFVPHLKQEKLDRKLSRISLGMLNDPYLNAFKKLDYSDKLKVLNNLNRPHAAITTNAFDYVLLDRGLTHALANSGIQSLSYSNYLKLPSREQQRYIVKAKRTLDARFRENHWQVTSDNIDELAKDPLYTMFMFEYKKPESFGVYLTFTYQGEKQDEDSDRTIEIPPVIAAEYFLKPSSAIYQEAKRKFPKLLEKALEYINQRN